MMLLSVSLLSFCGLLFIIERFVHFGCTLFQIVNVVCLLFVGGIQKQVAAEEADMVEKPFEGYRRECDIVVLDDSDIDDTDTDSDSSFSSSSSSTSEHHRGFVAYLMLVPLNGLFVMINFSLTYSNV